MKEFLLYSKETENKIRWDTFIEEVKFELYIPKWRIPDNPPDQIKCYFDFSNNLSIGKRLSKSEAIKDPELKKLPIISKIIKHSDKTKTIRFDPDGNKDEWEIGSPYIPISIIPNGDTESAIIKVEWV
ncbi:MAG: hypothetical protein LH629_14405 [Ignavibacteria bacterium]|nr:hypothetical protein [Ignavibacteria bacterium]